MQRQRNINAKAPRVISTLRQENVNTEALRVVAALVVKVISDAPLFSDNVQIRRRVGSVRTQYYVTVRYGYHTGILRPRNIQFYAPNFTPQFYGPRNTIPNQVNELS